MDDVVRKLKNGNLAIFVREDGKQQVFKVIKGVLYELQKDGEWGERVYLPRWEDLQSGKWIL
ncbi:hypothetical protein [Bacillus cereus group sp. BfR-BA-00999]|uniref:hypothetical protein n=1 Tax=Bacillus cereus group sp. BfR-BA-00999 TaxID=3094871 RepID=UPI0029C5CC57|nr:hypothetical protein [Bacillus cereus group sp. BfR-BA-00999]MDX5884977.1 hypothetical protein [Bacillus cereus group sp. BfR-BA-00999]